jgi:hypothetical protein
MRLLARVERSADLLNTITQEADLFGWREHAKPLRHRVLRNLCQACTN